MLNLSLNNLDYLNASSSLFDSNLIETIQLTHNKLNAENICAIEERVNNAQANKKPKVLLYPQLVAHSSDMCGFLTSRGFDARDGMGPRMNSCAEFEKRLYASGACDIIKKRKQEWARFIGVEVVDEPDESGYTYQLQGRPVTKFPVTKENISAYIGIVLANCLLVVSVGLAIWIIYRKLRA